MNMDIDKIKSDFGYEGVEKKKDHKNTQESHQEKAKTKLSYLEEKEWATIEEDIMDLEIKIEALDEEINNAGSDYEKIEKFYQEKTSLQEKLNEKYQRWEYLSEFVD